LDSRDTGDQERLRRHSVKIPSGEALGTSGELLGVLPSKGGESVEEKIKLAIAVLQLLLAIFELLQLIFKA
jgi:hypothetical protein